MIKDPNCRNKNWKKEELDDIVINEIKKLAVDPEYFDMIIDKKNESTDAPNKIEILKKEIEKIDNQISRFMDLYGIGQFTIEQVSDKINPLNEQKNGLVKELESLKGDIGTMSKEEVNTIAQSFAEILDRGDLNEIRLVIESLIYYIEVDNDDVYIHWKFV